MKVWTTHLSSTFEQYDSEENKKQYEKEQRQRTLERRIRETKREVLGLKQSLDSCEDDALYEVLDKEYQRKSALLAKQNAAYKKYCAENNLKLLSDRLQIASWDRKQAAAARGAARRYENALNIDQRRDIIKQRIADGEYDLKLSKQQYLKHADGIKQFEDYMRARAEKGKTPQGKLLLSEDETQDFINRL